MRASNARGDALDDFEGDIRDADVHRLEIHGCSVTAANVEFHVVRHRVATRRLDRVLVQVPGRDRPEPELGGRDRDDAGATADVEQAPALELHHELQDQTRRRMRPGSERAPGIDDDGDTV